MVWINFKIFKNFLFYWHLIFQNKHVGISCYIFIYRIDLIHSLIFEIQYANHSLESLTDGMKESVLWHEKRKKAQDGTLRKNNGDDRDEYSNMTKMDL